MLKKQIAILITLVTAASPMLMAGPVESTSVQTQQESPWSFNLSTYGWATAIDGTISAGGRSADVDIAFKDVLKHLDMTFMAAGGAALQTLGLHG